MIKNTPREPTMVEMKGLAYQRPATVYKLAPEGSHFEVGKVTETDYERGIYCYHSLYSANSRLEEIEYRGTYQDWVVLECLPQGEITFYTTPQFDAIRSVYVVRIISELKANKKRTEGEIKIGDIVTPIDGSSMPDAYHSVVWRGFGKGFEPVRVIAIEGNMLGVELIDGHTYHSCILGGARSSIWSNYQKLGDGFWLCRADVKKGG